MSDRGRVTYTPGWSCWSCPLYRGDVVFPLRWEDLATSHGMDYDAERTAMKSKTTKLITVTVVGHKDNKSRPLLSVLGDAGGVLALLPSHPNDFAPCN